MAIASKADLRLFCIRNSSHNRTHFTKIFVRLEIIVKFAFLLVIFCFTALAVTPSFADSPAPGKQVELSLKTKTGNVPYLLYLPREYEKDDQKRWPMVFFLHGRGESYGPLDLVTKWGPPKFAKRGDDLPYILVSPQCPKDGFWNDEPRQAGLVDLLDHITKSHRIDKKKVCLTGLSMGGYGSWRLAADHPKRFSCVVPVCGGGNPDDAEKLKDIPIWVFHGDQDKAVPYGKSVEMVDAIKEAGGTKIRFTTLAHFGHNSWSATYASPQLYQWMLEKSAP